MGKLHMRRSVQRLLACAVLLLVGTPAFAQFERSRVAGTIRDQQGGVMPGVSVTATNQATNQAETTVTDASGFYSFSTLLPGQYTFTAELQGFKKSTRSNVQLDAAGAITLDLTLETGDLSEEVTVTAEAAQLQTDVAGREALGGDPRTDHDRHEERRPDRLGRDAPSQGGRHRIRGLNGSAPRGAARGARGRSCS